MTKWISEVRRTRPGQPWTYAELDQHQQILKDKVARGFPPRVLLSEVEPVVTLGRREQFLGPKPPSSLPVYIANRGGYETYHGPGQWVLFVIAKMETWTGSRTAVRSAIHELLKVGFEAASHYRSDIELKIDPAGLWVPEGKLASVGIAVRDGVIQHGLALNVFTPTGSSTRFGGISPCGLATQPAYLFSSPSEIEFQEVGYRLVKHALDRQPLELHRETREVSVHDVVEPLQNEAPNRNRNTETRSTGGEPPAP